MTLEEVSSCYRISTKKVRFYEENGLLEHNVLPDGRIGYTEEQIRCVGIIHSLMKAGLDMEMLKKFMKLFYENKSNKNEQIRILRKQRFRLLEEIHDKQQSLDELDYIISELKEKTSG